MAKQQFHFGIEQATIARGIAAFKGLYPIPEGALNKDGDPITDIEWTQLKIREYIQNQIVRWEESEAHKQVSARRPADNDFEVVAVP